MLEGFSVAVVYVCSLLLPGALAVYLARITRHRFLIAYAISVGVLTFSQVPARLGGGTTVGWLYVYVALLMLVLLASVVSGRMLSKDAVRQASTAKLDASSDTRAVLPAFFIILTLWIAFYAYIGPYTEIPSDFWQHALETKWALGSLANGRIAGYAVNEVSLSAIRSLLNQEYVHSWHALSSHALSIEGVSLWFGIQLASTTIFLASFFWFCFAQLKTSWSLKKRAVLCAIGTLVQLIWFGIGDWAFIRYYAIAPVIFALPLFFLGILLFIDILKSKSHLITKALGIFFIAILCGLLHQQEAMYLATVTFVIGVFAAGQTIWSRQSPWPTQQTLFIRGLGVAFLGLAVLAATYVLLNVSFKSIYPGVLSSLSSKMVSIQVINLERNILQSIALPGVLSYLLLILNWKTLRHYPYVIAAALIPPLVFLNPLALEIIMRVIYSQVVWRFVFLVPTALILLICLGESHPSGASVRRSVTLLICGIGMLLALPAPHPYASHIPNRVGSFQKLEANQSLLWLADVEEFLRTQPSQKICTDPVTSYVLRANTSHSVPGDKFYLHSGSGQDFSTLSDHELGQNTRDCLVITNLRDGPMSNTVKSLQHWPADVLKVSRYYPDNFSDNLETLGLRKLWSSTSGDVTVFTKSTPP